MGPVIELRGLTKMFGRTCAVNDLTCPIEPGVVTAGVVAVVFSAAVFVINRRDP
jgi:hypothetical protein